MHCRIGSCVVLSLFVALAACGAELQHPFLVMFDPVEARFVRFTPLGINEGAAVALDELEVYAPGSVENLALATRGAHASASSCLTGYPQHAVAHLNDGRYGNDHSWVAATGDNEWARIELPSATVIDTVAFSRDRTRAYADRTPTAYRVEVSLDGETWTLAAFFPGPGGGLRAAVTADRAHDVIDRQLAKRGSLADTPRRREPVVDPAWQWWPSAQSICLNGDDWWMRQAPGQPHWDEWPPDTEVCGKLSAELPRKGFGEGTEWVRATVPGSVQTALLENGLVPTPWYMGLNMQALEKATVGRQSWFFKRFKALKGFQGRRVRLLLNAVDYRAQYYVNGIHVGASEGHFAPVVLDIDHAVRYDEENLLAVQIDAFPYASPLDPPQGRPLAAQVARTQVIGNLRKFDFVCASCPLGITDDVHLVFADTAFVEDMWVRTTLDDHSPASVNVQVTIDSTAQKDVTVRLQLDPYMDLPRAETVHTEVKTTLSPGKNVVDLSAKVYGPRLWWPNGYGPQNRYNARAVIEDAQGRILHESETRFGIRSLEMRFNEGHDMSPYPWTFVVNGVPIYAKGAGWVPLTPIHAMEVGRYTRILRQAQAAHFNMIRWWGGGVQERPSFYNYCDYLGIMVFQDFFLANNEHDNPRFLRLLDTQAPAFVKRLRNHPCVVQWNGGNELINGTVNFDAQAKLWKVAGKYDPDRPFYPSSPTIGERHAITDYAYRPERDYAKANQFGVESHLRMKVRSGAYPDWQISGQPHNAYYDSWIGRLAQKGFDPDNPAHHANAFDIQLTTEGGASAVANLSTLKRIIPADELANFDGHNLSASWLYHNATPGAYDWLQHATTEEMFGPIEDLATYVTAGQFARAQILAYGLEEVRRRKFRMSGTLMWQLNETWPNAAGNALVDNFATPRVTYDYVQRAYEPVHPSLRFDRIAWKPGEAFQAEVWLTSDLVTPLPGCSVEWRIFTDDGSERARAALSGNLDANASGQFGAIEWPVPQGYDSFFVVYLRVADAEGKTLATHDYVFSAHTSTSHFYAPLLSAEDTDLTVTQVSTSDREAVVDVANTGGRNALLCRLSMDAPDDATVILDANSFCLAPGDRKRVTVKVYRVVNPPWTPAFDTLTCRALNAEPAIAY